MKAHMVEKCEVLEISKLFADVPGHIRESLLSSARHRKFTNRQMLFLIDDPINEIFFITEGCAKVTQITKSGKEVVLRIAAPGELVGEIGLQSGSKHTSTAQALQECEVFSWPTDVFEAALLRYPILQRNVNEILRRRIFEMQSRICKISSTQLVSKRLAHELVLLSHQLGQKVDSHVEINIPQEALAQLTAMGLFTLNRILSGWEDLGVLRVHRQCIEIHDSPGLSELCM